jgi:AcrR family transcriptional regulator
MTQSRQPPESLKEACVQAARDVIAERGVENLSMRDVARKLDVSHQAPYRHFASRDHLLAEIMRRCFDDFARHLDERPRSGDAEADLEAMGHAYLDYARSKPLEYRLMFGTPWPEPAQHPELLRHALHAFDMLRDSLRRMQGDDPGRHAQADRQAMFIWSALHGMASITQADVMQHLRLAPGVKRGLREDMMARIGLGLRWPEGEPPVAAPAPAAAAARRGRRARS